MAKIEFNREKCIKCGACVKDCITYSIEQDNEGFAKLSTEEENCSNCISCQHCFAICPTGAITFNNKTPQKSFMPKFPESDEILNLIRSRKSIRQFKNEELSQEEWDAIKEMLPYIPTGCNFNSLHFSFIESKNAMDEIREYVNSKILKLISNKFTKKYAGKFIKFKNSVFFSINLGIKGSNNFILTFTIGCVQEHLLVLLAISLFRIIRQITKHGSGLHVVTMND